MPKLTPYDQLMATARACHPSLPNALVREATAVATGVLRRTPPPTDSKPLSDVFNAIMASANTTLLSHALDWLDQHAASLEEIYVDIRSKSAYLHNTSPERRPTSIDAHWTDDPHPLAAQFWLRTTRTHPNDGVAGLLHVLDQTWGEAKNAPRAAFIQCLLAAGDIWGSGPNTPAHLQRIARHFMRQGQNQDSLSMPLIRAIHARLSAHHDMRPHLLHAYGLDTTAYSLLVLLLTSHKADVAQALHASGPPSGNTRLSRHQALALAKRLPSVQELDEMLAQPHGLKTALATIKGCVRNTGPLPIKRQKGTPADAHTPEAIAKRLARAAKKAAAAQQAQP